uniref:Uncharacterized protein n=1 Tax=Arundo donax TaxID=35708 RepID=A0A0A9E2A0_ARUDO
MAEFALIAVLKLLDFSLMFLFHG